MQELSKFIRSDSQLRSTQHKQRCTSISPHTLHCPMKLRSISAIVAPLLLISIAPTPARAANLNATCLLQINGRTYLDSSCSFESDSDSDFFSDLRISGTTPGTFGYLFRDQGVGSLCWNGGGRALHAETCFEGLTRSGACWSNPNAPERANPSEIDDVKFCAWAQ